MEALIGLALQYLWPILAGLAGLVSFLVYRGSLIRKGERRVEDRVSREAMDRSLDAHEAAEEIRRKEAERAKPGDRPDADYPGGVRGQPPAGKPPPA